MTAAQRYNAKADALFDGAKALAISKGRCLDCWADKLACVECEQKRMESK